MDTPLFYILLFVHLVSLIVGFGAVIVIDTFGLLWTMRRTRLKLVNQVANVTQRLIWIGWGGLVASGIGLIIFKGFIDNLTMIKLFFVAMVGINGVLLHKIKKQMEAHEIDEVLPGNLRARIAFSSVVSQIGWWGAIIIGFAHRQIRHVIDWPPHPEYVIGALAAIFILIGFLTMPRHKAKALDRSHIF
ncbi:MAG: hypothetical protein AAB483_00655 [Patescibacteria group bacterium]